MTASMRAHAWGILILAVVFWLVPLMIRSLDGEAWISLPKRWSYQTRLAALFSRRAEEWHVSHVQVRVVSGSSWQDIAVEDFSPMGVFGYRKRLDQILEPIGPKNRDPLFEKLAAWVARRWQQLYPDHLPLVEVRFLRSVWSAHQQSMSHPTTAWVRPPVDGVSPTKVAVLATYRVTGRGTRAVKIASDPVRMAPGSGKTRMPAGAAPPDILANRPYSPPVDLKSLARQPMQGRFPHAPPGMPNPAFQAQRPTSSNDPKGRNVPVFDPKSVRGATSQPPAGNILVPPADKSDPMLRFFGPSPSGDLQTSPPFLPQNLHPKLSVPAPPQKPPASSSPTDAAKSKEHTVPAKESPKSKSPASEAVEKKAQ